MISYSVYVEMFESNYEVKCLTYEDAKACFKDNVEKHFNDDCVMIYLFDEVKSIICYFCKGFPYVPRGTRR